MGLAYTTGTISQPDAGSVGQAMAEKIRDDVVAHAAWELADEFTAASGTVRWYILKCLAASSGLSADFFIIMGRTLATGELRFAICESYTVGTRTMQFFSPNGSGSSTRAYDASGRYTATYVLGINPFANTTNEPGYNSWVPSGTSTKWWIVVADDGFTVAMNGAANGYMHCGAFTPLSQLAWPMPLIQMGSAGSRSSAGGLCRNPALANAANGFHGGLITDAGGGTSFSSSDVIGFDGDVRYNDKLQNNQRAVSEIPITIGSIAGQADYMTSTGWAAGKQKRMRVGGNMYGTPAGFAFGDAYALNGTLWVPYLPTDLRMWDTGVASS